MHIRIIINSVNEPGQTEENRSEVFSGDVEILEKVIYITKISVIADGQPQPICEVPFAIGAGHYMWIPPDPVSDTSSLIDYEYNEPYYDPEAPHGVIE